MLLQGSVRRMNRNVIPSSAFVILYYMDFLLKCNFHPGIFFRFIRVFFKHALGSGFLLINIQRNFRAKPYKAIPGTPIW